MFHLLSSVILILWYMNLMNNGQIDRGNENTTQRLPLWMRKTTKKPQSGWSASGFEPGISRMRVSCVTTEPPRSVKFWFYYNRKDNKLETSACQVPQYTNICASDLTITFRQHYIDSRLSLKKGSSVPNYLLGASPGSWHAFFTL